MDSGSESGTEISLSSESGVRRQFQIVNDSFLIAFTQEGKEFPECSSFSNILSSVRCERASDGPTASCFSLATSMLTLSKGPVQTFIRQYGRIMDKRQTASSKAAKQADFVSLAERLKDVTCEGTSDLAQSLSQCQADIGEACEPDNFPAVPADRNMKHQSQE